MNSLARKSFDFMRIRRTPKGRPAPERPAFRGFEPTAGLDELAKDHMGHTMLTMLLVLYPAMASAVVVIAASLLSAKGFTL